MGKITLKPGIATQGGFGTPMPENGIRNNTNSNTHLPPHPPVLCSKVLADGREDSWLEYIPDSFKPDSHPALVISCHGGGAHADMQFSETSWCYLAETEGLIAVFPNAGGERRSWLTEDDTPQLPGERPSMLDVFKSSPDGRVSEDAHHIKFISALIEEMKAKYNIDEGRVYMQGMSMGDIMTMMFARVCGRKLAGIDSTAGPSPEIALFDENGEVKGFDCPVPVYQSRGELDAIVVAKKDGQETTRQDINAANRLFWLKVNGCDENPRLSIYGVNNFAYYTGSKANVVFRDVKHRAHGQTFDDAQWAWHTLFKGSRRNPDGSISCCDTALSAKGDTGAAALCDGGRYAYINNSKVRLSAPVRSRGLGNMDFATHGMKDIKTELYVPLDFLTLYFGVPTEQSAEGEAVIHAPCGDLALSAENIGCVRGTFIESLFVAPMVQDGVFYVPVRWFAEMIFNMQVTECDGAMYISDHHGEMSKDMAYLIHSLLK